MPESKEGKFLIRYTSRNYVFNLRFEIKFWLCHNVVGIVANKQCDQIEDGARNVEGDEQKDHSKIKQVWNVACDVKKLWGFVKNTTAYQLG